MPTSTEARRNVPSVPTFPTDDQIDDRIKEINKELKDKGLSKDQKKALKEEKKDLAIEKQGNSVVGKMLTELNKVDPGNGLKPSDFTLTTDTKNDFAGKLSQQDMQKATSDQAFVLRGYGQLSGTIYIRTEPSNGFYQMSRSNSDFVYVGASALVHEGSHRFSGFNERNAFYVQDMVFHLFKDKFNNAKTYEGYDGWLHGCMQGSCPK